MFTILPLKQSSLPTPRQLWAHLLASELPP